MSASDIYAQVVADRGLASGDSPATIKDDPPVKSRAQLSLARYWSTVPRWLLVFSFYLVVAAVTIGRFALKDPSKICSCVGTEDPAAYMWALSWWPHAISHGINPFVTHYLWSPTGVNVAQGAMIPTAAIIMAPVTALFGSIFSYNLLSIMSPVLAAFTGYLLCRRLVKRELPALVGGYLFGFSSYEFAQLTGHLNLTLIFILPVMVHLVLRRADKEISRGVYMVVMALLIILQAGLSTELLADATIIGGPLLLYAWWLAPPSRRRGAINLLFETIGAGIAAMAITSPFLYYALLSGNFPKGAPNLSDVYALDFLNPFFPTYVTWLGHSDFISLGISYETGNVTEAGGYASFALIIAFVAWLISKGTSRTLRQIVILASGLSFILALGSHLHVAGITTVSLPFNWLRNLPIFDDMVPSRFVVLTFLAMAIGVASWLAMPGRGAVTRWCMVSVGAILIFPNLIQPLYGVPPHNPAFFSTTAYRHYLTRGETILALPFGTNDVSMLWQAETGFYFYMPEGYVSGVVPPPFNGDVTAVQLVSNVQPPAPALGSFIREHAVSDVIVDVAASGPWPALLKQLGLHPKLVGGVWLYHVPGAPA
jgi:hypothetical protein